MPNRSGKAYGLTALIPIRQGGDERAWSARTREVLNGWGQADASPLARVPNTYLCRFFVLDDVFFQGAWNAEDHLESAYLVFETNFHGEPDAYLEGMWRCAGDAIGELFRHCVAFDAVDNEAHFVEYLRKCQVGNIFYFDGSTDESLVEQLKGLYLKQEFTRFVHANQGVAPAELQQRFAEFLETVDLDSPVPRWKAGTETGEIVL